MKLKISCLNDREMGVKGTPSIRFTGNECTYANFVLTEPFNLPEDTTLTGMVYLMSNDDMTLNEINIDSFLRYVLSDGDTTAYLTLTNEPEPQPIPEPEPPTQEELLAMAKQGRDSTIISARDSAIYNGVTITTSYGEEHFTLSEKDQTLLLGIYAMVQAGAPGYPYHSVNLESRSTNLCAVYTKEDIAALAVAAFGHITYHESYANMLLQWLDRETDVDTVYTIEYGATLPSDLEDYLSMILTAAGIDPETFNPSGDNTDDADDTESGTEGSDTSTDTGTEETTPETSGESDTEVTTPTDEVTEDETATDEETPIDDTDPSVEA